MKRISFLFAKYLNNMTTFIFVESNTARKQKNHAKCWQIPTKLPPTDRNHIPPTTAKHFHAKCKQTAAKDPLTNIILCVVLATRCHTPPLKTSLTIIWNIISCKCSQQKTGYCSNESTTIPCAGLRELPHLIDHVVFSSGGTSRSFVLFSCFPKCVMLFW